MKELKYTLIADGSSDKTLMYIIKWLLDDLFPELTNAGTFADFRYLHTPPRELPEKILAARKYHPFDILFIHRDAERDTVQSRQNEVANALQKISSVNLNVLCIVPIVMMETWLLIDKEAIKMAAGNRNYKGKIELPAIKRLESEKQPKALLHELLRTVSGFKGRNLAKFNPDKHVHLVAGYIENFAPLRDLTAFQIFENDLKQAVGTFMG